MDVYSPDSLFEIARNAVNRLAEPLSWSWSVSNVMDWIQNGLKLPQYVEIFKENNIDGKKLIFINCQTLPSLGITEFNHMKYIAKNVRHLYGLSPDNEQRHNDPSGRRASVHGVYGRYYQHLAGLQHRGNAKRRVMTLFDYMRSVGLVVHGTATAGVPYSRLRTQSPSSDVVLLARLPATEYLRGGQCAHAHRAVFLFGEACRPLHERDQ